LIRGKIRVTGREGKHWLTRVNIRIKMVIIIVLKFNSEVDLGQGPSHYLGGSTLVFLGQHNENKLLLLLS